LRDPVLPYLTDQTSGQDRRLEQVRL